jgi:pantoate--beta-alanine ligase
MRLITTIADMQAFRRDVRARGKSVALVPTMGALHEGHLSLIRQAKRQCDVVIVSIFINPTQFDSAEDLARYPRNLDKDLELLSPFTIEATFSPDAKELYPDGFSTLVETGEIAAPLEGVQRPGHFRGVATVVTKLFNIIKPDVAYFGQKDFQQTQVIRRLVDDLNLEVRLSILPTLRETDGLAISSRNAYLNDEDRQAARILHHSLRLAEGLAHAGEADTQKVLEQMYKLFASEPRVHLEYAAIVDPIQLKPVRRLSAGCVALVAARVGPARLIDNLIFGPPDASQEILLQLALTARPIVDTQTLIPGFETEAVRLRIASCRNCAAISAIHLPPREFLTSYVRTTYADLGAPRAAVIGRDSPMNPDMYLYRSPRKSNRFSTNLFELLGVRDFEDFKARFVLTDAIRCHTTSPHVPQNALAFCAKHLGAELKLFPNLETFVVLGDDSYMQFQQYLLERNPEQIKPYEGLMKLEGWAREDARVPVLGERLLHIFYCYHPTRGYKRSPSIAQWLG